MVSILVTGLCLLSHNFKTQEMFAKTIGTLTVVHIGLPRSLILILHVAVTYLVVVRSTAATIRFVASLFVLCDVLLIDFCTLT